MNETRTVIPQVDPMTLRVMDFKSEELRLAQFKYSAQVVAGQRCDFRVINGPIHEDEHV